MRTIKLLLTLFALTFGLQTAQGQVFFSNSRVAEIELDRDTVGTTTAAAIAAADVGGNVLSWKICNDAVNTSTHLLVGEAADVSDDGVMLGLGQCFVCENCTSAALKLMRVEGQAAANGYSVIQYRTN